MEQPEELWEYECRIHFKAQDDGDTDEGRVLGELR